MLSWVRLLAFLFILMFLGSNLLYAMPEGQDRFAMADTNKDGKLSKDEFQKGFPNLTEEAFLKLDQNQDNVIDQAEWQFFKKGHKDMVPSKQARDNSQLLIEPPK